MVHTERLPPKSSFPECSARWIRRSTLGLGVSPGEETCRVDAVPAEARPRGPERHQLPGCPARRSWRGLGSHSSLDGLTGGGVGWGGGFEGLGPQAPPPRGPSSVTRLHVLSFQHVDTGNSYLCGYLKIKGLTEVSCPVPGCGVVRASGAEGQQLCSSTAGARLCRSVVLAGGAGRAAALSPLGKRTGSHLFPVSE